VSNEVHVVGAGLAGLAAAIRLAERKAPVVLHEAAAAAGGRCRSYDDAELGCRLDNGNHLLLSGNDAAIAFLTTIGARDTMAGPERPGFRFLDLRDGARWAVRPNPGLLPLWPFRAERRVAGSRARDYAPGLRLAVARRDDTVEALVGGDANLLERFWRPLTVAALNTEIEAGSARCLWQVVRGSFGRGGGACRPLVPREGLSESFVDPALAFLRANGATIRPRHRLRRVAIQRRRVSGLEFSDGVVPVPEGAAVVLAVPPWVAGELLPGLAVPREFRSILNVHFRTAIAGFAWPDFLGLVGGLAEWVFAKPGVVSVTVSAADRVIDQPADVLAARVWADLAQSFGQDAAAIPPWRVVKERRATFAATPQQMRLRPGARTGLADNLILAGDWTDTGLPATIEGAIRSGFTAARAVPGRG
jgi:squalene-associated FAD-dependent desaturase